MAGGKRKEIPENCTWHLVLGALALLAALRAMVYAMHPVLREKGIFPGLVTIMGGAGFFAGTNSRDVLEFISKSEPVRSSV